jgi:ATP-dependent Lon protease
VKAKLKDGPSAGGALMTALVTRITQVIRPDIAMTARLHCVVKNPTYQWSESYFAAHRGGIKHVLIPATNERLTDIPR